MNVTLEKQMKTVTTCEKCGTKIDRESELPCPGCLMQLGMANWDGSMPGPSGIPATQARGSHIPGSSMEGQEVRVAEIVEQQFPGLEIVELLGEGGMGLVYRARQTSLDRDVAIKVIRTDHQYREAFENRFAREAKALASLNHPNIVTVHDFGKTDDYFFLIMEFVDGINLRELLSGQKITASEALEIIPQICDALQYAHEKGVVHRDIKPENILVDRNGRVKIADYGLAKLINDESTSPHLTRTHHVMGTPHYMAPEQVEKPLSVDHRADIYSLGVVIYEMLTGELPLGRFGLPSEKADVDSRLDQIVIHSLEKEPDRRYQKVSQVKTDFQSVVNQPSNSSNSVRHQDSDRLSRPDGTANPQNFQAPESRAEKPVGRPLEVQQVGAQKPVVSARLQPDAANQPKPSKKPFPNSHRNPYETATTPKNTFAAMISPRTYLNAAYLLIGFPLGLACFVLAITTVAAGVPLTIVWIGLFVLYGGFQALQFLFAVERKMCHWLLGEVIYHRSPAYEYPTRFSQFVGILTSSTTWWGILYSIVRFPWCIICFVLVLVFFTVPLILLAAPILFTQWWFQINLGDFEVNSMERAILAALMGFPIFYVGVQITNGLAFVSLKLNRFFLSRL